ncbi:hypothetical protein GCM10027610_061280 [Dactylosporangium cerinum]
MVGRRGIGRPTRGGPGAADHPYFTPAAGGARIQGGATLDVYNFSTADGGRITQWARGDGANQQWQFVDSGGGYYRLKSKHSGKVLDVYNLSTADGAAIVQWADGNGTNQQFRLADSSDGYVRLLNRQRAAAAGGHHHRRPVCGPQHADAPHPGPDVHRDGRTGLLGPAPSA